MTISEADQLLTGSLEEFQAASFTLYVRDPYWPDEYRLVSMPGVTVKEPMYGFVSPPRSRKVVCEGDPELFCEDARTAHSSQSQVPLQKTVRKHRELFNDFGMREKVGAYARFFLPAQDRPLGILFANFPQVTTFGESLQSQLRELASTLSSAVPDLIAELGKAGRRFLGRGRQDPASESLFSKSLRNSFFKRTVSRPA